MKSGTKREKRSEKREKRVSLILHIKPPAKKCQSRLAQFREALKVSRIGISLDLSTAYAMRRRARLIGTSPGLPERP